MPTTTLPKNKPILGEAREQLARELAERYRDGATIRGLMAETGRSYGFVHRVLTVDAGVTLRPRGGAYQRKKARA